LLAICSEDRSSKPPPSALRLQPSKPTFDEALALFGRADFERCLESLQGSSDHRAVPLGTRSLIRIGRLEEASATIEAFWHAIKATGSDLERGEANLLRGMVAAKCGDSVGALEYFATARGYLFGCTHSRLLLLDLENQLALLALNLGDLEVAEERASRALDGPLPQRVLAREILSHVYAASDRFRDQIDLLELNFRELAGAADNVYLQSANLRNIAVLAQELDRIDLYEVLSSTASAIRWTEATRSFEARVFSELGMMAARYGDHLTAFKFFRRSGNAAPTLIGKLEALLEGATVAREINEKVGFADRIAQAEELVDQIDWSRAARAGREILYTLAEEQARLDSIVARRTYEFATSLGRGRPDNAGPALDSRLHAISTRANGIICKAEGRTDQALPLLQQAFDYWLSVGFEWEAAATAVEMLELDTSHACLNSLRAYVERTASRHLQRKMASITAGSEGRVA